MASLTCRCDCISKTHRKKRQQKELVTYNTGDLRMQTRWNKKDVLHPESEDVCMYPRWFHVFKFKELCTNKMKQIKYGD